MSFISQDEINLLNTDSKYKSYVSSIEKALKNFESSTEWADLIASLGKLKKVLQSFPKYPFIPKRVSVCKRLAQCLHPALPSGVHLKALEVYTVIFQNIGIENLSKDLFLYSSGLFPLLANAALTVKPILLNIYETYFLPLKQALRPCLTGLILGILPGLEEGSDYYQRTFNLLKNICLAQSESTSIGTKKDNSDTISISSGVSTNSMTTIAEDKYFYTCLWSAIVSQSSIRFPAIQFIITNYENKKKTLSSTTTPTSAGSGGSSIQLASASSTTARRDFEDQLYLIGNSIDLMINGICSCLQDPNPLVQRNVLDLICLCLPINSCQITKGDKLQLIVVAIHVVLRRDMSLNRRIYSWLMGNATVASSNSDKKSASGNVQASKSSKNPPPSSLQIDESSLDSLDSKYLKAKSSHHENYFNQHAKHLLIAAIKMLLNKKESSTILYLLSEEPVHSAGQSLPSGASSTSGTLSAGSLTQTSVNTSTTLKILKIVSNLVERQEIGQAIIDDILLDLLFYVYKECNSLIINGGVSINHYKKLNLNANGNSQMQQQQLKELNDLKKATCNFLFQSFQLYFIWDFCAKKFEKICKNYTNQSNASHDSLNTIISPAQLCDLYEFILDLLTNAVS